jgi:hypothetical protein
MSINLSSDSDNDRKHLFFRSCSEFLTIFPEALGIYGLASTTTHNPILAALLFVSARTTTIALHFIFCQMAQLQVQLPFTDKLLGIDAELADLSKAFRMQNNIPLLASSSLCILIIEYSLNAMSLIALNKGFFTIGTIAFTAGKVASRALLIFTLISAGYTYRIFAIRVRPLIGIVFKTLLSPCFKWKKYWTNRMKFDDYPSAQEQYNRIRAIHGDEYGYMLFKKYLDN